MTTAVAPRARTREYADFLQGKRIVVVGPAAYLQGQGKGEWIDSHDVVVKLNWGETLNPADYGRTDVLYKRFLKLGHLNDAMVDSYLDKEMRWLIGVGTGRDWQKGLAHLSAVVGERLRWFVDRSTRDALYHEVGGSPLLGMIAIKHLLAHDVASVHVTGCDFYDTGYAAEYGGEAYRQYMKRGEGTMGRQHDGPRQVRWLAQQLATDKRLSVDDRLTARLAPAPAKRKRKKPALPAPQSSGRFEWTPLNVTTRHIPAMSIRTYIEQKALRQILQPLGQLQHAAEVGCGFGRMTIVLSDHAAKVSGFEREKNLVTHVQRLQPDVAIQQVEALTKLPAADGAFDFAMTFTVLQHMSHADVRKVIAELQRISSRYVLIVEDTDPTHVYIDRKEMTHFTLGRSVEEYSAQMQPFRLVLAEPRQVEPTFRYKKQPRPFVGHYMLFERSAA